MSTLRSRSALAALVTALSLPAVSWAGIAGVSTEPAINGCNYFSIDDAIQHAPSGSTIYVLPGTYVENWGAISLKDLTLEVAPTGSLTCREAGKGRVTVDAGSQARLATVAGGSLTLRSFDIVNGDSAAGGGQLYMYFSNLTLDDSTMTGGNADENGGNVKAYNSTVTLENGSALRDGHGDNGGCLYLNASPGLTSRVTLHDTSIIEGCEAYGGSGNGGGVYLSDYSTMSMHDDSAVEDNLAIDGNGGGVYVAPTSSLELDGNARVSLNKADDDGGGVYVDAGSLTLGSLQSAIRFNDADGSGGGVYSRHGVLSLDVGEIRNNQAVGSGGGLMIVGDADPVGGVSISYNDAGLKGGGVHVIFGSATFDGTLITGNEAPSGGGLGAYYASIVTTGAELSYNTAELGGGVYLDFGGSITMAGGDISHNTATTRGGGLYAGPLTTAFLDAEAAVDDNSTVGSGGGVLCEDCDLSITGASTITNNTAGDGVVPPVAPPVDCTLCGGGVAVDGDGATAYINHDAVLDGNRAKFGGAIWVRVGEVSLGDVRITHNRAAPWHGGGVYVDNFADVSACGTYWGVPGTDDNAPDDVKIHNGGTYSVPGVRHMDCSQATGVCVPKPPCVLVGP